MYFFEFLSRLQPLLPVMLGAVCAIAWGLCNKPRFLAWQGAGVVLAAMAQAWLWLGDASHVLVLQFSGAFCVGAAACMSQATASRLGQPRAMRWGLAVLAMLVVLLSTALRNTGVSCVLAWACAGLLGQKLWMLWHIPLRHQWERWMLLAHTACAVLLLCYPLVAIAAAEQQWVLGGWTVCAWVAWLLYSAALIACAWADNPYRSAQVRVDPLTGLMPFAALKAACEPLPYARGLRVLILCELDASQRVRTQHSAVDDDVLRDFARILQNQVREGDHVARIEGNEFAIALRHIDLPSAQALAQRIHVQLSLVQRLSSMVDSPLTASFGIAPILEQDSFEVALHRADVQLYQAQDHRASIRDIKVLHA